MVVVDFDSDVERASVQLLFNTSYFYPCFLLTGCRKKNSASPLNFCVHTLSASAEGIASELIFYHSLSSTSVSEPSQQSNGRLKSTDALPSG